MKGTSVRAPRVRYGAAQNVKKGQFVVGSFATSDNTCPHRRHGYQSSCVNREFMFGAQSPLLRVGDHLVTVLSERVSDD